MKRKRHQITQSHKQGPTPSEYLTSLFTSVGVDVNAIMSSRQYSFQKPNQHDIDSYDLQAVMAMRSKDLEELRRLHSSGKSMRACNQFGESLMHLCCRRGDIEIVTFMVQEAKVPCDIRDDYGRTPLHDSLWTAKPNFHVVDVLLEAADPSVLIAPDVRGATPFDYARREHYEEWIKFLQSRKETLLQRIKTSKLPTSSTSVINAATIPRAVG